MWGWLFVGIAIGILLDGLLFDMPWTPARWRKR